ncbi:tetratricopeptide repeat protein, partial [Armatimonas sp.]|uniref:tetratricopeptide repeat protein n=1 Tax=Armatimonas sp. TaxID=1872638 RepID=UPI00286A77EB
TKQYAEALPYCEKALALAPAETLMMANLGEVLCHLGRVREGRKHLEEALARTRNASSREEITKLLKEFPDPGKTGSR